MPADDTPQKWDSVASFAAKMESGSVPGLESEPMRDLRPAPPSPSTADTPVPDSAPDAQSDEAPDTTASDAEAAASDEEPDDSLETESDTPALVTVKIDGKEEQVTLEEALKGYSRNRDYLRKTDALAKERQAHEAELQAVRAERERYAEALRQIDESNRPTEPDWPKLRAELSPDEYQSRMTEFLLEQRNYDRLHAETAKAHAKVEEDRASAMRSHLQREQERLLEVIPEWSNPEKAQSEQRALAEYGKSIGFTPEEVASITDHRAVVLLRKAMLFDKAKASPKVQPGQPKMQNGQAGSVQATIQSMKPGTTTQVRKPVSDVTRAKQSLAKTGTVQAGAKFFEAFDAAEEAADAARRR